MALPISLTPITRSLSKIGNVVSPTGIGVLLSVGAHAALFVFGPRTNFSFATLSKVAQEAEAQETVVPLVQLSPNERNRLPNFAQPRSQLPNLTGLGSLPVPNRLPPVPSTSLPRQRPVLAKPLPPATIPRARTSIQPPRILSRTLPFSIPRQQVAPRPPLAMPAPPSVSVLTPTQIPNIPTDSSPTGPEQNGTAADLLPRLEPGTGLEIRPEDLAQTFPSDSSEPSNVAINSEPTSPNVDNLLPNNQSAPIDVPPPPIATASAQGDPTLLLDGNNQYDTTATSEEEAEVRKQNWIKELEKGNAEMAAGTAEISIKSEFKACRENPPVDGRLGVVVNPDGSQSEAIILKSIGYDILNRLALTTLEYEDFGTPEVPTQFTIDVKVVDKPEECSELQIEELTEPDG